MALARPQTKEYTVRINVKLASVDDRLSEALGEFDTRELKNLTVKMALAALASTYCAMSGKSLQLGLNDQSMKPWARRMNAGAIPLELALFALYMRELRRRRVTSDEGREFKLMIDRLSRPNTPIM